MHEDDSVNIYKNNRIWRIMASLIILNVGWAIWWISMFSPASTQPWLEVIPRTVTAFNTLKIMLFGALMVYVHLIQPGLTLENMEIYIDIGCMAYFFGLVSLWIPAVFRTNVITTFVFRLLSLGMLTPLYFLYWQVQHNKLAGPGEMLFCSGSILIGISSWVTPAKIDGEPKTAIVILWRARKGTPILRYKSFRPDKAFPVSSFDQVHPKEKL